MKLNNFIFLIILNLFCLSAFSTVEQDSIVLFKKLKDATTPKQKAEANVALAKFYLSRNLSIAANYVNSVKSISTKNNGSGIKVGDKTSKQIIFVV